MRALLGLIAVLSIALLLPAAGAHAYFRIELRDGGVILADRYEEEGTRVVVYRRSGTLQFDRSSIESIDERSGQAPTEESAAAPAPAAPAPAVPAPEPAAANAATAGAKVAAERRNSEIAQELILKHRDLLFARNGGATPAEIEARRKEIDGLNKERSSLRAKLGLPLQ